tara:strand:- start:425 stop:652 length:228 start_codon:yes stop_codon:yes gene_type:complete
MRAVVDAVRRIDPEKAASVLKVVAGAIGVVSAVMPRAECTGCTRLEAENATLRMKVAYLNGQAAVHPDEPTIPGA